MKLLVCDDKQYILTMSNLSIQSKVAIKSQPANDFLKILTFWASCFLNSWFFKKRRVPSFGNIHVVIYLSYHLGSKILSFFKEHSISISMQSVWVGNNNNITALNEINKNHTPHTLLCFWRRWSFYRVSFHC